MYHSDLLQQMSGIGDGGGFLELLTTWMNEPSIIDLKTLSSATWKSQVLYTNVLL